MASAILSEPSAERSSTTIHSTGCSFERVRDSETPLEECGTIENRDDYIAAYTGVLGQQPLVDKWTFSTNGVAIAGRNGIPCLGLGPGNEVYGHAANEACPIEHLNAAVAFYAAFVAKLNGKV